MKPGIFIAWMNSAWHPLVVMQKHLCQCLVIGVALTLGLRAQVSNSSPATNVVVVTPALVNLLAEELRTNHLALRAAAARTNAAQANVASIRVWDDPTVKVGGLAAPAGMRMDEGDIVYGVDQKLPLFGKPQRARRLAQAELSVEQADADYRFQALRRELAKVLFQAALANRVVAVGIEDLRWLEAMVATTEQRYLVGEAAQTYVLRLQNEQARRADQLITDRNRSLQELAAVNRLLNRELRSPWPRLELPPVAGNVVFSERLARFAMTYEPKLKLLRQQTKLAETAVEVARRSRLPDLSLGAETRNYSGNGDFRQSMVTLSLSVPWGNARKYRQDLERERAKLRATELDAADYQLSLREEVYGLTISIDAARREAVLYRDEIVPRAELALASAQSSWSSNRTTFNDVLEARRMLLEARLMQARAVAEQYDLLSELVLCCGLGDLEALQMIGAQPDLDGTVDSQPPTKP